MKPNNKYTLYFKNDWLSADQIGHEFMEHALHFGNGITSELRSYGYNGGPHVFKAKKYVEEFIAKAHHKGIPSPLSVDELISITYELLDKNHLVNATIRPVIYWVENEAHLMVSVKKSNPFTIRENLHVDQTSFTGPFSLSESGELSFDSENPLFFIKHGVLYTPKVAEDKFPGIIRDTIIECALALGYPVIEKSIVVDELEGSEAVFFSNQMHEMSFVQRFENYTFSADWRETMAMDLLMMFRQQATNEDFWNYSII